MLQIIDTVVETEKKRNALSERRKLLQETVEEFTKMLINMSNKTINERGRGRVLKLQDVGVRLCVQALGETSLKVQSLERGKITLTIRGKNDILVEDDVFTDGCFGEDGCSCNTMDCDLVWEEFLLAAKSWWKDDHQQ